MYSAIIFDMDGVLIDSQPLHYQTDIETLRRAGFPAAMETVTPYTGVSNPDRWPAYKRALNLPQAVDVLIAWQVELLMAVFNRAELTAIDGVAELLRLIKQRGLKTAVASSSSHALIDLVLMKTGLAGYIDLRVSGEDVRAGKPAPDVFLHAARRLGVSPAACAVVEDAQNGVAAAKAAGMFCVAYRNPTTLGQDLSAADLIVSRYQDCHAALLS